MDPQLERPWWARLKANRLPYTLTILATLSLGVLIGTVISKSVKGQESKKSDATPLAVPDPRQLSNQFTTIAKQLEPSVVNINTESTVKNPHRRGAPQGDDDNNPFDDFFIRDGLHKVERQRWLAAGLGHLLRPPAGTP